MRSLVWINGAFRDAAGAIDASDRGFLLGDGAFETIYVERGRPAFLTDHINRLDYGLSALRIPRPAGIGELAKIISELCERNGVETGAARISVTRGAGPRGLAFPARPAPTTTIGLAPSPTPLKTPARVIPTERVRYSGSIENRFKVVGGYLPNMLALDDARRVGADDALLINERGRVVCATSSNVFLIDGEGARTPPLDDGALPGVVRGLLLSSGKAHGVRIVECPIEAKEADRGWALLTNSVRGVSLAALGRAQSELTPPRDVEAVFAHLKSWYAQCLAENLGAERRDT